MGLKIRIKDEDYLRYLVKECVKEVLSESGLTMQQLRQLPSLNEKIDNLEERFIKNFDEKMAVYTDKLKKDKQNRDTEKLENPEKFESVGKFVESFNDEVVDFEGV